jgi:hypothetical protein
LLKQSKEKLLAMFRHDDYTQYLIQYSHNKEKLRQWQQLTQIVKAKGTTIETRPGKKGKKIEAISCTL